MSEPAESASPAFDPSRYVTKISGRGGGGDYLVAAGRIAWFRHDWPAGTVDVEHVVLSETWAVMRATVTKVDADGVIHGRATDYATEYKATFGDYVEKASTSAVSRALRCLGYGTAEASEVMEEGAITDAPVAITHYRLPPDKPAAQPSGDPGENWASFWKWARARGLNGPPDVEKIIKRTTDGLQPSSLLALIVAAETTGDGATVGANVQATEAPKDPAKKKAMDQIHGLIADRGFSSEQTHQCAHDLAADWYSVSTMTALTIDDMRRMYRKIGEMDQPTLASAWGKAAKQAGGETP